MFGVTMRYVLKLISIAYTLILNKDFDLKIEELMVSSCCFWKNKEKTKKFPKYHHSDVFTRNALLAFLMVNVIWLPNCLSVLFEFVGDFNSMYVWQLKLCTTIGATLIF